MNGMLPGLRSIVLLIIVVCCTQYTSAQDAEIEWLKQRLIDDALARNGFLPRISHYIEPDFEAASEYLADQNQDGSWSSVDYLDTDNSWDPLSALNKILIMSLAYNDKDDALYRDPNLLEGISNGLIYWYQVSPICVNWYKNDIAKQMYLSVIAILMQDHLREDLIYNLIEDQTARPRMTGSNRTLVSISVFYRGVLEKNPERIALGVSGVMDPVRISDEEGIQVDYSFHQHGPYLYNGSYGANFLRETAWLASIVQGTAYAFDEEHLKILRDYFQHGSRWMIWKDLFDYNARGRQVGRPSGFGANGDLFLPHLNYLETADPDHAALYQESVESIEHAKPQPVSGLKHFWRSDYSVAYRDNYFITLRMCSERTIGVETNVNFENLMGYYLPYGLTYVYQTGNEYENIFPVWNWARLPGVTSPDTVPVIKGKFTQPSSFVGGVTDGKTGISSMDLQLDDTRGKKSWLWFEDGFLALGAGIESSNSHNLFTGINQTSLKGKVIVDGNEFMDKSGALNPRWIWHDSVGYLFPVTSRNLNIEAREKTGELRQIFGLAQDTTYRKEVFSLWYDHAIQPKDAQYAYAVFPGMDAEHTEELSNKFPLEILSNNTEIQAVRHEDTGLLSIVFHKATSFPLSKKWVVSVSDPCLLLIDIEKNKITVSDPTTSLEKITVQFIKTKKGSQQNLAIQLPQGAFAGQSKTAELDLKIKL